MMINQEEKGMINNTDDTIRFLEKCPIRDLLVVFLSCRRKVEQEGK